MRSSIVEKIYSLSRKIPDKLAVLDNKNSYSYLDLFNSILKKYIVLKSEYKIEKGDEIALAAVKDFDFISSYFAVHLSGAICIPIDVNSSPDFIAKVKKNSCVKISINIDFPQTKRFIDSFDDSKKTQLEENLNFPEPHEIADYMFTSGTSNLAKGVILSHDNINNATNNINEFIGNDSSDTEILVVPIHHSFGMARLRCVLSSGGTLVLVKSLVNIKRIFRIFSETKITGIGMVPSSWSYLKKMSGNKIIEKFQNLKYIEFGSAFMSEFEKKELVILFPETKICMHYGLTEASRSCFLDFKSDYNYLYSVGIPSSRTKIITIDPKNNKRLERGEIGEICISGPHVSKGYLNVNKDEVFYDDYIRTGDLGFIDKNGYLVLEGRLKDIINIGGKKVSPLEIEEKIYEFNNKIKSACVGIKDNNNVLGEVIKVFIEKDSYDGSFTDISNFLKKKLESHKIPTAYEFIDKIPQTSSGKIKRNKLI